MFKRYSCIGIYKYAGQDCSNKGLSSIHDNCSIVENITDKDVLLPDDVIVLEDEACGQPRIRAVPVRLWQQKAWTMFGGCFIYTSNGIVPHHGVPIPLHDRVE